MKMDSRSDLLPEEKAAMLRGLELAGKETSHADELVLALSKVYRLACDEWPQLRVSQGEFFEFVASRVDPKEGPHEVVQRLIGGDLLLACGCCLGDPLALRLFRLRHGHEIEQTLSRLRLPPAQREELVQVVTMRLLVRTPERAPELERYAGTGSLRAWLRVVATRTALNEIRTDQRRALRERDAEAMRGGVEADLETDVLRRRYHDAFRQSFEVGVAGLSSRERSLLRQSIVHGMNVRNIAALYGVHHATAARWVALAREQLLARTKAALAQRIPADEAQMESVLAVIRSELELSITRILGGAKEAEQK